MIDHLAVMKTRGGWFALFTYILFISSTFSVTGVSLSIIVLYFVSLYHLARQGFQFILPRWIYAIWALYWASLMLSSLTNDAPGKNLLALHEHYRIFLPFTLILAFEYLKMERLLKVFLFFLILISVYGFIQYFWGVDWLRPKGAELTESLSYSKNNFVYRAKGNFSVSLTYGGFLVLGVHLFLSLFIDIKTSLRFWWLAGAVLGGGAIMVSFSRTAWMALAVGMMFQLLRYRPKFAIPGIFLGSIVLIMGISLAGSGWLKDNLMSEKMPILIKRWAMSMPTTEKDRLYNWESGWEGIKENPLLGVGYGNYGELEKFRLIISKKRNNYKFHTGPVLHNNYLQVFFFTGVVGLLAYLALWGGVLVWGGWVIKKSNAGASLERGLLIGSMAGLAGSVVSGLFENQFYDAEVHAMIMISMGMVFYSGLKLLPSNSKPPSP